MNMAESKKKIAPFKVYSKCLATNTRSSYIRNTLSNAELDMVEGLE